MNFHNKPCVERNTQYIHRNMFFWIMYIYIYIYRFYRIYIIIQYIWHTITYEILYFIYQITVYIIYYLSRIVCYVNFVDCTWYIYVYKYTHKPCSTKQPNDGIFFFLPPLSYCRGLTRWKTPLDWAQTSWFCCMEWLHFWLSSLILVFLIWDAPAPFVIVFPRQLFALDMMACCFFFQVTCVFFFGGGGYLEDRPPLRKDRIHG